MRHGLPFAPPGLRVGLLGGSFDPPHGGHAHISRRALKRLGLDAVWWLVTPGNPLKAQGPAPLDRRMAACRALTQDRRIHVSDVEARLGLRYTAQTLAAVKRLRPGVRFVWLMGADNLAQLHLWEDWRAIVEAMPIGVLARPGEQVRAGLSPAARIYAQARRDPAQARDLALAQAPAWTLLPGPMTDQSSTRIRDAGAWRR